METSTDKDALKLHEGFSRQPGGRIGDFMSAGPITVRPATTLEEAFLLMSEFGIHHLPVEKYRTIIGVVSDKDIARAWAEHSGKIATVEEAMERKTLKVHPDCDMAEALAFMKQKRVSCVVIQREGEPISGIFTTSDALRILADAFQRVRGGGPARA